MSFHSSPRPPRSNPTSQFRIDNEENAELESTEQIFCLNVIHNVTQFCLGGLLVSAFYIPNVSVFFDSLSQHIILCTIGYFILMSQAILFISPFGWGNELQNEKKKIIHFSFQFLGAALAISGSILRMTDIGSNFSSGHAICGLIAMIAAILSLIVRLTSLIYPQEMNTKMARTLYSFATTITLFFAFIAIIIAFNFYYTAITGYSNGNFAIVLSVLAMIGTILIAIKNNLKDVLKF